MKISQFFFGKMEKKNSMMCGTKGCKIQGKDPGDKLTLSAHGMDCNNLGNPLFP